MFETTLTVSSSFTSSNGNADVVVSLLTELVERGVPLFDASGWAQSEVTVVAGLLRRLRCQLDHADAVLCGALDTDGRDANAQVARTFQIPAVVASRLRKVSDLVGNSPVVSGLLRDGVLSETHVRALQVVADETPDTINQLARAGAGLGVGDFENLLNVGAAGFPQVFG